MRRNLSARSTLRRAQFERFEDRLVLSCVPWVEPCADSSPGLISTSPDWAELAPTAALAESPSGSSDPSTYVRTTYGFDGAGQTAAIIDTGIAWDHVALGGGLGAGYQVVGGWDFTEENDANPYDDGPAGFHGTHVAGILASQDATRPGVAPGVDLVALRVFNDQGLGLTEWVEQALDWVHDHRNDFRFPITTVNMSLGAQWNAATPPDWAALEDELAQLVQDGIFISVAAGNNFARYGQPGLAYPAASPYVVPVASVGDDGQLSSFSQRQERVLAAPGEFITSTVPDFVLGADGDPNDWAAASGTSMAAPYLAGASMLVREAMQFVGYASIAQSDIYNQMRATSDRLYDTETGAYYNRLNLPRAIDSLLPRDDYSSILADPFDLGLLQQTHVVTGQLARLDDQDVFQFTASASGNVTWSVDGRNAFGVSLLSADRQLLPQSGVSAIRVDAGQTYTLVVSAAERLTDYNIELSITADQQVTVDGNIVRVAGTTGDDTIVFSIDSQYQLEVNGQRYRYARDRAWQFEIDGGGGNDRLTLAGSPANDTLLLRPGSADLSGPGYVLGATGFATITASAQGGSNDIVRLFGTTGSDQFTASPTSASMAGISTTGVAYLNRADGFERVYGYAQVGQNDVARLYDSQGDDEYLGRPKSATLHGTLEGTGYFIKAWNFDRVYAYASAGNDTARLFDSKGNERFVATPTASSLEGDAFFHKAWHFDRVYAYARAGGDDIARLYDSQGNELFVGTPKAASITGNTFFYKAWHFDQVYAYASGGPNDVARLNGSTGDDLLVARSNSSSLQGGSYFYKAWNFDRVYADAVTGTNDIARLYDSPEDDTFVGGITSSEIRGATYFTKAYHFDQVYAVPRADRGVDIASLPSSGRADEFFEWDDHTTLRVASLDGPLLHGRAGREFDTRSVISQTVRLLDEHLRRANSERRVTAPVTAHRPGSRGDSNLNGPSSVGQAAPSESTDIDLAVAIAAVMRHEMYTSDRAPLDIDGGRLGQLYLTALDDLFESLDEL